MRASSSKRHLLAILFGVLLACMATESVFRLFYRMLPSLEGLHAGGQRWGLAPAGECPEGGLLAYNSEPYLTKARRLGVYGDSVAAGVHLSHPEQERFGARVAAALSEGGTPWIEVNAAHPGASWCSAFGTALSQLAKKQVDAELVAVFADDLAVHAMVTIAGQIVAFPEQAPAGLRWWVSHSYLANGLWLGWNRLSGEADRRYVSRSDQLRFIGNARKLQAQAKARQIPLLFVLIPPIGEDRCPDPPIEGSPCVWMQEDLRLLSGLLEESGVHWLDLRGAYGQEQVRVFDEMWLPLGNMVIHPNPLGHDLLARQMLPALKQAGGF